MKKRIALLLVLAMVFAFAGCGSDTETDKESPKSAETTQGSGEVTQEQTEPDRQPEQVSLEDALRNTAEELEAGNLTVSMEGYVQMVQEQQPGLVSGMNVPLNGQFQIMVDPEAEDISVYGTLSSTVLMNIILHDGWLVTYDDIAEAYYKEDISEELEGFFAESEYEDLEDLLGQIPEEYLEGIEEIFDLEKLQELAMTLITEKFADEQWLNDTFGYTATTENGVTVHTYDLDLVVLIEAIFGHFEEAFQNEDDFLDLMDMIGELSDEMPEFTLQLKLIQTGDRFTGIGMYLEAEEAETEQQIKLDITLRLSEIGTTAIDTEMLEDILDGVMEYDELYEEYYGDGSATEEADGQSGFIVPLL